MLPQFSTFEGRRLHVLSHPNHELALFGVAQRFRPHFVYLTDGGGEERVEQTRGALRSLGLLDQATFLNHPEKDFYDKLLDKDSTFFRHVAQQVREVYDKVQPELVCCDALEFYNPVHDLALPIVCSALDGLEPQPSLYEIPLVYQEPGGTSYVCQRMPKSREASSQRFVLSETETKVKAKARDEIYTLLKGQMGPTLDSLTSDFLGTEEVAVARRALPPVPPDQLLRYEWRAEKLQGEGKVERVIRFSEHFVPVAESLFN